MPLYLFLTIFRALSISLFIVTLPVPFIWIPVYTFLVLVIICIGYHWTSQEKDFITRGLKSAFTSGSSHHKILKVRFLSVDVRFKAERIFHTYWFVVNLLLLTPSTWNAFLNFSQSGLLSSDTVAHIVCISSGLISLVVFYIQQRDDEPVELTHKPQHWVLVSIARRRSERSINEQGQAAKIFLTLKDLIWTILDYGNVHRQSYVFFMLGHPIWATVNLLTMFLPGIEWQSFKHRNCKLPGKSSPKISNS